MTIDLKPFCAKPGVDGREYLYEPFSAGEWTYASNGHIIVRVRRLADDYRGKLGEGIERAEWDGYREQFKALVERKMYALAAKYEGAPRDLRRHFFDRQMDLLMQWRGGLEQAAERRA